MTYRHTDIHFTIIYISSATSASLFICPGVDGAGYWGDYNCDLPNRTFTAMVLPPQIPLLVICITIIVTMTSTIITTYPIIHSLPWHCHHPHQDHHRRHHHQGRADSKDGRRQHRLCDLHRGRSCTWCLASGYSQDQTIIILITIFMIIIIWSSYS